MATCSHATFSGSISFSGALYYIKLGLGRHSTWSWGFINVVFSEMFAFAYGYAGAAQILYFYILPSQIVGMVAWERRLDEEGTAFRSPNMSFKTWLFTLVVSGVVCFCYLLRSSFFEGSRWLLYL